MIVLPDRAALAAGALAEAAEADGAEHTPGSLASLAGREARLLEGAAAWLSGAARRPGVTAARPHAGELRAGRAELARYAAVHLAAMSASAPATLAPAARGRGRAAIASSFGLGGSDSADDVYVRVNAPDGSFAGYVTLGEWRALGLKVQAIADAVPGPAGPVAAAAAALAEAARADPLRRDPAGLAGGAALDLGSLAWLRRIPATRQGGPAGRPDREAGREALRARMAEFGARAPGLARPEMRAAREALRGVLAALEGAPGGALYRARAGAPPYGGGLVSAAEVRAEAERALRALEQGEAK